MAKMVLEMQHITKTFPGVKALDDVSLQAYEGEILFLRQLCRQHSGRRKNDAVSQHQTV